MSAQGAVRELTAAEQATLRRMRSVSAVDADGNNLKTGLLGFGTEPNPDASDRTEVGTLTDVTSPDA